MRGIVNFKNNIIFDSELKKQYKFQGITYEIVYSGHIYNIAELKELLYRKNVQLENEDETEILVKLYIVFKKEFIDYLNGAYSFVIWNNSEKELFAVRDRFGLEPFYYTMKNGNFIFATSINEIFNYKNIKVQMDNIRNK